MTERFAKTLKKWRGKRYQKNAADDLQIPLATYRKYENGKRTPPGLSLAELIRRMDGAPDNTEPK